MFFYTTKGMPVNLHNLSAQESGSDRIPGLWQVDTVGLLYGDVYISDHPAAKYCCTVVRLIMTGILKSADKGSRDDGLYLGRQLMIIMIILFIC